MSKFTWLRFIRFGYPWMVVWGICVHLMWGMSLWFNAQVGKLTILVGLQRLQGIGLNDQELGGVLIAVALLALWAIINEETFRPRALLAMLLPQYGLLVMALLSDAQVIIESKNPNTGAYISPVLLVTILGPVMIAALLHTLSIIERFVIGPRRGG